MSVSIASGRASAYGDRLMLLYVNRMTRRNRVGAHPALSGVDAR